MLGLFNRKIDEVMPDVDAVARADSAPLNVVDPLDEAEVVALPAGLQTRWHIGERIPWKGIWFVVIKVDVSKLELIPERMTKKLEKRMENRPR